VVVTEAEVGVVVYGAVDEDEEDGKDDADDNAEDGECNAAGVALMDDALQRQKSAPGGAPSAPSSELSPISPAASPPPCHSSSSSPTYFSHTL
jgi:hypothetical protein